MVPRPSFVAVSFALIFAYFCTGSALPSTHKFISIVEQSPPLAHQTQNANIPRRILRGRQSDDMHEDVPQPGLQSQNITTPAGVNDTHVQPGVITTDNTTYPESDCRNLRSGRDNKCWDELHLTDWVRAWMTTHQCYPNEPFARCFMRLEDFYALDCTGLKLDACTPPQAERLGVDVEVFYVAFNIYGNPLGSREFGLIVAD